MKLLFHLFLSSPENDWAGEKQQKSAEDFSGSDKAAGQRWIPDHCWCEGGEKLKERHIPAVSIRAALWGQQLKRFGELHHLEAKGDNTNTLVDAHKDSTGLRSSAGESGETSEAVL